MEKRGERTTRRVSREKNAEKGGVVEQCREERGTGREQRR